MKMGKVINKVYNDGFEICNLLHSGMRSMRYWGEHVFSMGKAFFKMSNQRLPLSRTRMKKSIKY